MEPTPARITALAVALLLLLFAFQRLVFGGSGKAPASYALSPSGFKIPPNAAWPPSNPHASYQRMLKEEDAMNDAVAAAAHEPTLPQVETAVLEEINRYEYTQAVYRALVKGRMNPDAIDVVPVFAVPLFHDHADLMEMLPQVTVPVRLFVFIWNSENDEMRETLERFKRFPFGVVIRHTPTNLGFSGSVNAGIIEGIKNLRAPLPGWFFIVNADAGFPDGTLRSYAIIANQNADSAGMIYGPREDHFAFAITRRAVQDVGFFDEALWPIYMEDIDYRWRIRIAGLSLMVTHSGFQHKRSINLKKPSAKKSGYLDILERASFGHEYGWRKWGRYVYADYDLPSPPSGYRTPFNIPNAPLSLWEVDPAHRECLRTGKGVMHPRSGVCWYNASVLYERIPQGAELPKELLGNFGTDWGN